MYPVTQDFLDKMKATERRVIAKVQIDYTDPFLDQSIQCTANEQANVSYPAQTADAVAEPFAKYAALDGSWVLGEDWALAPGPEEAATKQMGWWGSQLSQADGTFVQPYPSLTVTHFARPIYSLKVVGDSKRGEWPVDFRIDLYGPDGTLLYTENVTGNNSVEWSKTLASPVLDVTKQVLTITKWSHPGRQAKILEFFTSVQGTYEGDDILLIHLLEEREVSQGSLPVGNISANEIDIRLDNSTRKFDAGNTQSPLYRLLKQNRRIRAWLGVEAENNYTDKPPTFIRNSVAYKSDATQVAANQPRFDVIDGVMGLMVEEGTTNLVSNPSFESGMWPELWNPPNGTATLVTGWNGSGNATRITITKEDGVFGIVSARNMSLSEGVKYTISFRARAIRDNFPVTYMYLMSSSVSDSVLPTINLGTTWQRYTITYTIPAGKTASDYGLMIAIDGRHSAVYANDWIEVDDVQIEAKPYATSFIDGTRSPETLTIPTSGVLNPQEGTVEIILTPITSPTLNIHFEANASTTNKDQIFIWNEGGVWRAGVWNSNGIRWSIDKTYDGQIGQFKYLALTWKNINSGQANAELVFFVDGVRVGAITGVAINCLQPTLASIGRRLRSARYWGNALYDDLRISSRARTDEEIAAAYASGQPLPVDEWTTYKLTFNGSIYPVEKVWVPLGTFWSGDWSAPEDGVYAQTTGRDRLELLRKSTYSTSQVQQNKTLYDLAVAVLQDAGLKPEEYWVDPELQQYTIPYAYFEPQSHREALRKIAEACLGQVYCDRNGIVRVEGPSYLASKTTADITITQDDYFRKDNPVKWGEIANYIEVETQPLRPDVTQEVYRSNDPVSIAAGQTLSLTAYYNNSPCINAIASLSGAPSGCVIQSATYYAWGADVKVYSPNAGIFTLVINAQPLKILNKEKAIAKDDASITDNGLIRYTFPANPLVQTLSMAQTIANKLLESFKDPRRDVEVEWRGNPALLLGDRVSIIDNLETNDYYIIRQKIEYDGALRARLSGRKA